MRPTTSGENAVLSSRERFVSPVVVEIQNGSGTWKALTNLSGEGFSGLNFFKGATWATDVDAPMWTGTVSLSESQMTPSGTIISIAPDVETSPANVDDLSVYAPLIDGMRRIRWTVTTKLLDGSSSTTKKMFDGYVVSSAQQGAITLQVADLGHFLLTTQVEDERVYGSDAGVLLSDVIQQILDDNLGTGVVTLVTDTGSFVGGVPFVKKFSFGRPRLLTGIRDLAINTVGANVRYMWNSSGEMELRLFMPPRAKVTADFTFGAGNYEAIPQWNRNTEDVRNVGKLYYYDSQKKTVRYVAGSVPDSVTRYGRRYFEFVESATSQVDTEPEAQLLLDTALADLAFPKAEKQFTTQFAWPFDIYDLFTMSANGKQYTSDQSQYVTNITHTLGDPKTTRTQFSTRGTIAGFYNNWLIREGEGGKPPEVDSLFLVLGVLQEGTMYGGELFDGETNGCVWPGVYVGKDIRRIHVWGRENAPGTLVPLWPPTGSDSYKACTIERPEGAQARGNYVWPTTDPNDPYGGVVFWRTYIPIPTGRNNDGTMRTLIIKPETFDGTFGDEQRFVATAIDDGSLDPAGFASVTAARGFDPTQILISWTPSDADPSAVFIMRDGIVIARTEVVSSASPVIFFDNDLKIGKTYNYSIFRFNGNKSGPRTLLTVGPWSTDFSISVEMQFTPPSPRVRVNFANIPVGTDKIWVQKSKDNGQYNQFVTAAIIDPGDLPYLDVVAKAGQYYRGVAVDSSDVVLDTTDSFFWRSPLALATES